MIISKLIFVFIQFSLSLIFFFLNFETNGGSFQAYISHNPCNFKYTKPHSFTNVDIYEQVLLIEQDSKITTKCLYVWWIMNDFSFSALLISHEWIFIFAQWAENLCFTSLTQHWHHCLSEAVEMDVLRNCLCIKFKLAAIIIHKIMGLRANYAINKSCCVSIIFSTLFTAKSAVYQKKD